MANAYKYVSFAGAPSCIQRLADGASIPISPGNADYQRWLAEGGGDVTDPPDAEPIKYGRLIKIPEERVTTTGTTPAELFRATLPQNTGYLAHLRIVGIADNFLTRAIEAVVVVGRVTGGAVIVQNAAAQNQSVLADHRSNATAGSWTVVPSVSGNDYIITVTGSAGRTVDWRLAGEVESFTPGGS